MAIKKVKIKNFKLFNDEFTLELHSGLNILVGPNEAGKSTILEAIHVALTGLYAGRSIRGELSQYLFNKEAVERYIRSVNEGTPTAPPSVVVEIFFDGEINAEFEGNDNSEHIGTEGLCFEIAFDEKYREEYERLVERKDMRSLPIEYYEATWTTFARQTVTTRSIPVKSALIDSSNYRTASGSDVYISRIVKDLLSDDETTSVAQAHRIMKDAFSENDAVKDINKRIRDASSLVDGEISLDVALGTKNAWEDSLIANLDGVPFGYVGKGAQGVLKTELALANERAQNARVILLEEPENHQSFSRLNRLISAVTYRCGDKQILVTTHSSFVANKLGLENLILLNKNDKPKSFRLSGLKADDFAFFKRLPGYDTLRALLCKKAILVEGASDELVVQKAYKNRYGRLPIEDGVDVISVGTAFQRFLTLADALDLAVTVVTDNDGKPENLRQNYAQYMTTDRKNSRVKICFDFEIDEGILEIGGKPYNYNTLEPKMVKANGCDLALFNRILGKQFKDVGKLRKYMQENKTECALAVFEFDGEINFPQYILDAIDNGE